MGGGPSPIALNIPDDLAGQRLDRALTALAAAAGVELSRSRVAALIAEGAVEGPAGTAKHKVAAGEVYRLALPAPVDPDPQPEAIPLDVVHEDDHLIVVDKPAGMVVHPAPGAPSGNLVNALLHHCGASLAGIGGERRPGIVHRIDKDTSGLLVAAKTEAAHTGLSRLFATHDIERVYRAIVWGAPDRAAPRLAAMTGVSFERTGWLRVETEIGRHPSDRKRMAVVAAGGRRACTFARVDEAFGRAEKPAVSLLSCRLETGRTHQIRVHLSHIGHPLVGDPIYGRPRVPSSSDVNETAKTSLLTFPRQALHAAVLGFKHPISDEILEFCAELPPDMHELLRNLRRNP